MQHTKAILTSGTVVKSQNSAHIKKALAFEKTKEIKDCTNQSSIKPANRVPEFTPILPKEKDVEKSNDNYLHKKFKKIAGISDCIAKTEKAEIKTQNGFVNDAKSTVEPCNKELVPSIIERISNKCNLDIGVLKNDGGGHESKGPVGKVSDVGQVSPFRPCSPKQERTRSPQGKKFEVSLSANSGRYSCPYCQLACAKPSVLQKHIRAHTNERPYPCSPCGFAFKTKSNLYKHCRSQAHRFKTGETGQTGSEKCDSGEELSDDSLSNQTDLSPNNAIDVEGRALIPAPVVSQTFATKPTKASESDTNDNQCKIYKPKFHKATLYQDEKELTNSEIKQKIHEGIMEKQKKVEEDTKLERPSLKIPSAKDQAKPGIQSPIFGAKNLPPSPEFLNQHISKIISDNQAIVETMEPKWTKKFLQRQNSRDKEVGSPLSTVSSPNLDPYQKYNLDLKKQEDSKSKLALALLKTEKNDGANYNMSYLKPEVNLDNHTYQPLNLTKKDSDEKSVYQNSGGSVIKEILIKSREAEGKLGQTAVAEILQSNTEEVFQCSKCKLTFEDINIHRKYYCTDRSSPDREVTCVEAPYLSPGPLLGTTPLVDVKSEVGPPPKKRRTQSTSPDNAQTYGNRRLSTSSLPCSMSPSNGLTKPVNRSSSSPSATLKSLEELSKYPMKPSLNMFGGEVKILDCGETKTMRIESNPNPQSPVDSAAKNSSKFFVTIAKTGLHSGGGTLVHVPASTAQANPFQIPNILNYPDTTKLLMPLMPNISTPNLAVPGVPTPNMTVPPQTFSEMATIPAYKTGANGKETYDTAVTTHNGGILTIVHGGRQIPYVPGIPGPQTVLPSKVTDNIVKKEEVKKTKELKSTVSSLISVRKLSSSNQTKNVPNEIPKIEISAPEMDISESRRDDAGSKKEAGQKFLRPTSLPLRPGSFTPKRLHQGITPTVLSLVSPETPRPKKSYGQLFLNGHAYTYLGLKCSTRSYYCTISRPQPMYVVQSAQYPKLSMYSNWKVYSESEPCLLGLTPAKAMAHYDSRHRSSSYTIADKYKSSSSGGIVTHSSSWLKSVDKQSVKEDGKNEQSENVSWSTEPPLKRVKIFAGGYESNEDYTYVRGRGRGRYVCEECGIRCKKPSMLKKHIRTHTDVRPYTCKHCTFSFKTKGNLTKHMKSKAHYKKCMELNIHPIPTTVEAENIDEELLVKQQAMKQDGNEDSENDEEEEEDESDGGDEEEAITEDPESLEREAACSLLSLSEMTTRSSQYKLLYVAAGLIPKSANGVRPNTYPYVTPKQNPAVSPNEKSDFRTPDESTGSAKSEKTYDNDSPIDLSQKENKNELNFLSKNSEFLVRNNSDSPKKTCPKTGTTEAVVTPTATANSVPPYLLASINSSTTQEQHDKLAADLSKSHMLQAYLTAKALHDVKIKQLQSSHKHVRTFTGSRDGESEKQFDMVSQLHQNFCRVYEKTVENDCVNLKRFRGEKEVSNGTTTGTGTGTVTATATATTISQVGSEETLQRMPSIEGSQPVDKTVIDNSRKYSLGDSNSVKLTERRDEDSTMLTDMKSETKDKCDTSDRLPEKSENVSVTLETSAGKMILVNIPTETDRGKSSLPTFLSKSGDTKLKAEFFPPSSGPSPSYVSVTEDGRSICVMCNKIFTKASQLKLHVNIHYFERPYRCEPCAVSFRTKGHLQKHERSGSHHNKVSMNTTFGTATTSNPRPFNCDDCKIAFRIHGHLAKHLRSKMHIMKLECIGKLPFGTYAEMERSGINLNEIDTTDCENSLESLQILAQKLYGKDPTLVPLTTSK
ncbi:hypothetical protein RUM43_012268 [Polyplax serrata]|uniref:C2H2-type domain-containing protein n=1 Tax=Polyplax serrata TaxID=468196 RepID=A0AAN8S7D1_POLSC